MNRIFKRKLVFVKVKVHRSVLSDLQTRKKLGAGAYPEFPFYKSSPVQSSPIQSSPRNTVCVQIIVSNLTNVRKENGRIN